MMMMQILGPVSGRAAVPCEEPYQTVVGMITGVLREPREASERGCTGLTPLRHPRPSQDTSLTGMQGLIESWALLSYASMLGSLSRASAAHMCPTEGETRSSRRVHWPRCSSFYELDPSGILASV